MSRLTRGTTALLGTSVACLAVMATSLTGSAQYAPAKPSPVPAPVTTRAAAPAKPAVRAVAPVAAESHNAVIKQYCVTCHSERRKTGGLSLEAFDVAQAPELADVAE